MSRVAVYSGAYHQGGHLHGLGYQIYDPVSGDYVDALPASDNPTPQFSPTAYNVPDVSYPPASTPKLPGSVAVPATGTGSVAYPSPRVAVPLSSSSLGLWFTGTTMGLPNWALGLGLVAGVALIAGSSGRRR